MSNELSADLETYTSEYYGGCDLTRTESVAELPLDNIDAVINLAGLALVGSSFGKEQAERYQHINVKVHTVIADRLLALGNKSVRLVAVSTGAVYDNHQPMPLGESSKLATQNSPYALSKVAMEKAMLDYASRGLDIVVVRPFNHIGPGQLGGFLVPDLVSQVTKGDTVVAGDLTTQRDYTDVRDVVKAYVLLATIPELKHRLYNVCSGKSITGQSMLNLILIAANNRKVSVSVDESLIRPNDPKRVVGDNARLREDTGWQPTIAVEQTIADIVRGEES